MSEIIKQLRKIYTESEETRHKKSFSYKLGPWAFNNNLIFEANVGALEAHIGKFRPGGSKFVRLLLFYNLLLAPIFRVCFVQSGTIPD